MDAFEAISLPEPAAIEGKKYFSVSEANRALALVKLIVRDIVREYKRLLSLHNKCQSLDSKGKALEAEEAREKYAAITDHLARLRDELADLGCELKDYGVGLVEFPALYCGREVLLCWKPGEEIVSYWHDFETSHDRRPIPAEWI